VIEFPAKNDKQKR